MTRRTVSIGGVKKERKKEKEEGKEGKEGKN